MISSDFNKTKTKVGEKRSQSVIYLSREEKGRKKKKKKEGGKKRKRKEIVTVEELSK